MTVKAKAILSITVATTGVLLITFVPDSFEGPAKKLVWSYTETAGNERSNVVFNIYHSTDLANWSILGTTNVLEWNFKASLDKEFFFVTSSNTVTGDESTNKPTCLLNVK